MEPIVRLCEWLGGTEVSQTLQTTGWMVPMVQAVHIMAIAMVIVPVLLLALRLLGIGRPRQPIPVRAASLGPAISWALLALLISGVALVVAEPRRELLNAVFQTKMALLLAAVTVTVGVRRWAARSSEDAAYTAPLGARGLALLSLFLWVAVVSCGRWIAYVQQA